MTVNAGEKLKNIYKNLSKGVEKIYVVPAIRTGYKQTDYLYQLYKVFLESGNPPFTIESLSAAAHPKFFFGSLKNENSILHYHWFELHDYKSFIGILWKIFWIQLYKITGGKVVWTVHNKFPHTHNFIWVNKFFRKYLAKLSDKIHVHCNYAIKIMSAELNVDRKKFFILEHPEFPAKFMEVNTAKSLLTKKYPSINFGNRKTFLMFGNIADYKRINETARLFKDNFKDKLLIVAGQVKLWDTKYFAELQAETENSENVIVIGKLIPEDDVPLFLNSIDYLLFNYRDILTSGGVMMGLSYNKKVITPNIGCIKELVNKDIIKFESENQMENLKRILSEI